MAKHLNDKEEVGPVDVLEETCVMPLSVTSSSTPAGLQSISPLSSLLAFSSAPASPSFHGSPLSNNDSVFDYDPDVALSLERGAGDVRAHTSSSFAIAQLNEDFEIVGGASLSNPASDLTFFGHPRSSPSPTLTASEDTLSFGNISPISQSFMPEFNSHYFGSFSPDFLFFPIHIVRNKAILPVIFLFLYWTGTTEGTTVYCQIYLC